MACIINQSAPWGDVLMLENPGEELYFGEVYRQVLQEAWVPSGSESWERVGKSRRGIRPPQKGLTSGNLTPSQELVRGCFSKCATAWRALPWEVPPGSSCDNRNGRKYWKDLKDKNGLMCSYYDLYMRICMPYTLAHGCVPPANYLLIVEPSLSDIACNTVYDLSFPNKCGAVSMVSGDGLFVAPSEWVSPKCGTEGELCFKDENGSYGSVLYRFAPDYWCEEFVWPSDNPTGINPDESKDVYVEGGAGPFSWSITGTGFSFSDPVTTDRFNSVQASPGACGTGRITVTDNCGNVVAGVILCSAGVWVLKSSGVCVLSGVGTLTGDAGGGGGCIHEWYYELISGNKRQLQTRCCSGGSSHLGEDECGSHEWAVNYCDNQNKACCGDPPPGNCIDPNRDYYPYHCYHPGDGYTHYDCYCVKGLEYYEWECP